MNDARLLDLWSPRRKAAIEAAFRRSRLPYAMETWKRVHQSLRGYAAHWARMHRETCSATHLRRSQTPALHEARLACLHRREHELRGLLDMLQRGGVDAVQNAATAARSLGAIEDCAHTDLVRWAPPLPRKNGLRRAVQALRATLARIKVAHLAARAAESLLLAEDAVARARKIRYAPALAELLYEKGMVELTERQGAQAEKSLLEAMGVAEASRHDRVAANGWLALVFGAAVVRQPEGNAAHWLPRARAAIARIGNDTRFLALLELAEWSLTAKKGQPLPRWKHWPRAQGRWSKGGGPDLFYLTHLLVKMGNTARRRRRFAQALECFQRALALSGAGFGAQHPHAAYALVGFADLAAMQGRWDEARAHFTRSLRIMQTLSGPWHPHAVRLEISIASMESRSGRYHQARTRLARLSPRMGPEGPSFSFARRLAFFTVRGQLRRHMRKHRAAVADLETALQLAGARWGKESPRLISMILRLGNAHVWGRRYAAALRYASRAEGLLRGIKRPRQSHVFFARRVRALAIEGSGQTKRAIPELQRALALRAQGLGSAFDEGRVRFALARALWRQPARRKQALQMGRAARRLLSDTPPHVKTVKSAVTRWLASPR